MTEELTKRKLTAILSADVKGYSRLMQDDEEDTVRTISSYREVMTGLIEGQNGKVVDAKGDNLLAEFPSVVDAVRCAVKIQKELKVKNDELPENRKMEFLKISSPHSQNLTHFLSSPETQHSGIRANR